MMRWSPGTAINYRWITKSWPRASCNSVNRGTSQGLVKTHLAAFGMAVSRTRQREFATQFPRLLQSASCNWSARCRQSIAPIPCAAGYGREFQSAPIRYMTRDTARTANNNHLVIFIVVVHPTTIDALTYRSGALPGRLTDCYNAAETSTVTPIWLWGQYALPIILYATILNIGRRKKKRHFSLFSSCKFRFLFLHQAAQCTWYMVKVPS